MRQPGRCAGPRRTRMACGNRVGAPGPGALGHPRPCRQSANAWHVHGAVRSLARPTDRTRRHLRMSKRQSTGLRPRLAGCRPLGGLGEIRHAGGGRDADCAKTSTLRFPSPRRGRHSPASGVSPWNGPGRMGGGVPAGRRHEGARAWARAERRRLRTNASHVVAHWVEGIGTAPKGAPAGRRQEGTREPARTESRTRADAAPSGRAVAELGSPATLSGVQARLASTNARVARAAGAIGRWAYRADMRPCRARHPLISRGPMVHYRVIRTVSANPGSP